jgi:hypothetical protein
MAIAGNRRPSTAIDATEVVVTTDTVLYKDVTGEQFGKGSPPPVDGRVQQQGEAGSLDEIGDNSIVSAWGSGMAIG